MASSQPDPLFDGDSDSDINSDIKSVASTISLTSTVEEYDPEKEYPVEAILAEKDDEEGKGLEYLIKWGGYEMHECTWEPAAMFSDKIVLNEWKDTKMQVLRGLKDKRGRKYKDWHAYNDSNIIAFEEAYMKWGKAKKDRRLKRRAKRIRLGLPVKVESDTEQEESDSDTDDDESDEQPIIVPKPRQSTNESRLKVASGNVAKERDSKPAASVAAPNPVRKGSMPFIEESSSGDDDEGKRDARRPLPRKALSRRASSADLSGDSLMEELKQQKKSRAEPTRGMLKRKTVDAAGHSSASTDARPPKQKSSKLPSQREGNRQPSNMGNGESSTDSDAPLVPNRTTQKIRKPIDGTVDRPQKVETQVNRPPQLSSSSDVPLSKEASKRSADIIRKTVDSNADPKSRSTLPTTASRAVPPAKDKPRVPQPSPSTAIAGASSGLKKKPPIAPPSKGPTASPLITDRPPPVRAPVPTQLKKPAVPGSSTEPRSSSSVNIRRPSVGALVSAQGAKPPENPPATMMKRTGGGGGIKMNMSAIPPPKPERKPTKQREYNSLSHQNNARKKAAQEGNPDPSVLEFIRTDRPSEASGTLGAPARKLSSTTTNPYSLRGNESAVLNRGEQTPPARELSSTTTNPYSLRGDERTALSRGEQAHQEEPTGHTHTVREDEKWKEQVTCFEWRNGTCRFNEKCRFLHRDVEFTSEDMKRVQKVGRVPLTCYFWWNNEDGCFKTSEACPFAHWNTGTVAGAPGHKDTETVDKFRLPPRTGGKLTCLAWLTHTCSFPGDHYPFMHSHVGSGPVGQTLQRRTSLPGVPQDAAGTSVQTTTRQPRIREPDPAEHMQRRKSLPRVLQDAGVSVNPATKQVKFNKPAPPLAMPQPLRALQQQMLEDVPHVKVRLVLPASKDGEVSEVDVLLMGLDVPSLDELRATLGAKPRLTISHNCSPAGWEAYCLEVSTP
ncbi:hypothetical protein BU16DRAFT_128293 [Lophium mytilinum]|uniref:Chromo domain-containing protein n=1 Tax=Lophium mytilinum TaxID=390894 RepID=A0A6A6QH74_9PEZI|nr:hypothetical protein BU16DRAFT_128293 [Lophium mytilinum]